MGDDSDSDGTGSSFDFLPSNHMPSVLAAARDFASFSKSRSWYKHLDEHGDMFAVFVRRGLQGRFGLTDERNLHWWFVRLENRDLEYEKAELLEMLREKSPETAYTLALFRFNRDIDKGSHYMAYNDQLMPFLLHVKDCFLPEGR